MEQSLNLLIIEDHEIVVWALTQMIDKHFPNSNIHAVSRFPEGLSLLKKEDVDLIILDIHTPGGGSPTMINELKKIKADVKILIHTAMPEEEYALDYLRAGVNGYILKSAPHQTIIEAIRQIQNGHKFISPKVQHIITGNFLSPAKNSYKKPGFELTEREKGVVRLLMKGKWTKEIADELELKQTTISTHKGRIFEKFEVNNPIELYIKIQKLMPELLM
jgi:two-component system invasion response regulator UvrY